MRTFCRPSHLTMYPRTVLSYTRWPAPLSFQLLVGFEPLALSTSTVGPPWKVLSLRARAHTRARSPMRRGQARRGVRKGRGGGSGEWVAAHKTDIPPLSAGSRERGRGR